MADEKRGFIHHIIFPIKRKWVSAVAAGKICGILDTAVFAILQEGRTPVCRLPPLADMHTHTDSSPDSKAPIVSMCEAALRLGLPALAVTDHVEMTSFLADGYDKSSRAFLPPDPSRCGSATPDGWRSSPAWSWVSPMFDRERSARLLRGHPYDFVLGSLHNLEDGVDYFHYDYASADIGAVLDIYFRAELELVEMGGFQSLAHLTYPMRYMPEYKRPADTRRWQDVIDTLFRRMAEQGIALEINTSGLRQAIGQTSPDLPLIRRFRELGGENITIGSDAHRPEDVGAGLETAAALALEAGFRDICQFREGKPVHIRIG